MEEITAITTQCSYCRTEMGIEQNFCVNCGYPEKGSPAEQSGFHARRVMNLRTNAQAAKSIRSARNSLYVISAITLLFGLVYFFSYDDSATLIASAILALIYLGLGFWSQTRPLVALILGLLVFLTTNVINASVSPETLYKGILLKVFILVYLGKGINATLKLRNSQ